MENLTEMLKGVLEGCVLEIISHEEIYGKSHLIWDHLENFSCSTTRGERNCGSFGKNGSLYHRELMS